MALGKKKQVAQNVPIIQADARVEGRYSALGDVESFDFEEIDDAERLEELVHSLPEIPVPQVAKHAARASAAVSIADGAAAIAAHLGAAEAKSESLNDAELAEIAARACNTDPANFRLAYESRDGGLFLFEDKVGHLYAVRSVRLA